MAATFAGRCASAVDAIETDSRQKSNQTPCAFCSIDCVVTGDDVEDVTGAGVEELLDDEGTVDGFVTDALGEVELCGLPLLLHAAVRAATKSTAAIKPL